MLLPFKNPPQTYEDGASMAQNRAGQTGDQDCSGHTPEHIYAGERQLVSNRAINFTAGSQGPMPEIVAWTFFIEKYELLKIALTSLRLLQTHYLIPGYI